MMRFSHHSTPHYEHDHWRLRASAPFVDQSGLTRGRENPEEVTNVDLLTMLVTNATLVAYA